MVCLTVCKKRASGTKIAQKYPQQETNVTEYPIFVLNVDLTGKIISIDPRKGLTHPVHN